jgi:hypothetical protein
VETYTAVSYNLNSQAVRDQFMQVGEGVSRAGAARARRRPAHALCAAARTAPRLAEHTLPAHLPYPPPASPQAVDAAICTTERNLPPYVRDYVRRQLAHARRQAEEYGEG